MMQDKVLIVTGALGALGKVVAEVAQSRGARIAGIDHAPSRSSATPESIEIGGVDLSDAAQAKTAVEMAAKHFGRVDALVNIAGGFAFETIGDGDIKTWQRMYALNVLTALNTSRAALPHLAASRAGRIVNIGAMSALQAGSGMGPYAASKAGVHRHHSQPRRHAEGGLLQMGDATGTRRGDPVPRQRGRQRHYRRADSGQRAGVIAV